MPDGGTEGLGEGHSVWGECSFGSAGPNFLEMTLEHRWVFLATRLLTGGEFSVAEKGWASFLTGPSQFIKHLY